MQLLYRLSISFYLAAIRLAAAWGNRKAKAWVQGRKDWKNGLKTVVSKLPAGKKVWFHCASLGEFEQAKPLIERLKQQAGVVVIVSFFSPSGYENKRHYPLADALLYLPLDTADNARFWVQTLCPDLAIFVKYELWYHYLHALHNAQIPLFLVAAKWRRQSSIFRFPLRWFYRPLVHKISRVFTQDVESQQLLLDEFQYTAAEVAGDTRIDNVLNTAASFEPIAEIEAFVGKNSKLIVAGSTWKAEQDLLMEVFPDLPQNWKLIVAPHEIEPAVMQKYIDKFPQESVLFSQWREKQEADKRILWIDNIGMLARLYAYADLAVVGGGFNGNLHNILEPCAFLKPIAVGAAYKKHKFTEALLLQEAGGLFPLKNPQDLKDLVAEIDRNPEFVARTQHAQQTYLAQQKGATEVIMRGIWVHH